MSFLAGVFAGQCNKTNMARKQFDHGTDETLLRVEPCWLSKRTDLWELHWPNLVVLDKTGCARNSLPGFPELLGLDTQIFGRKSPGCSKCPLSSGAA